MRRIVTAVAAALAAASLMLLPGVAYAESADAGSDTPSGQDGATLARAASPGPVPTTVPAVPLIGSVKQCLDSKGVWLVVITDVGMTLANQCVTQAANAAAVLTAAGLSVQDAPNGGICQIGNFPTQCLTDTTNRSWQHFTATTTSSWAYAQVSPEEAVPTPGTLEGWCYGIQCSPPDVLTLMNGINALAGFTAATSVSAGGPLSSTAGRSVGIGIVIVVLAAAVTVIVVVRLKHRGGGSAESHGRAEA